MDSIDWFIIVQDMQEQKVQTAYNCLIFTEQLTLQFYYANRFISSDEVVAADGSEYCGGLSEVNVAYG